ncbi:MAG: lysophospholipid acyltransferase family protein [Deltaproteobacteria bacterium]|nr:lysophospholipid acyltransferase family protein [Deltaproteobacteria bacterium]MBW2535324.1 lysophospholipid acyltransferase family protein [Deltaproteobacteria bacterium]
MRYSPPAFGLLFGAVLPRQREAVRRTLRRVYGPRPAWQELRDVAEVFRNFACCLTDAMLVGAERGYRAVTQSVGGHHMMTSLEAGRGVVVVTAHTAGWDIGAPVLNTVQPRDVMVVMEPEPDRAARELQDQARRRAGVTIAHVGDDPLASLPLLGHLRRRGGVVAMKFDRSHPGMRSRSVRFLGEPWQVAEGPLRLAALSGAPIVPVFTRRLGFLTYQLINMAPIHLPRRPSDGQLSQAGQRLATALEGFVRAYPTHWFRFSDD